MLQSRHFVAATVFALAGMLVPAPGRAATVTQFHVHLRIRSSCQIHLTPNATQAPIVSCSRGQPPFAIKRLNEREMQLPAPSAVAVQHDVSSGAPKVWEVTF